MAKRRYALSTSAIYRWYALPASAIHRWYALSFGVIHWWYALSIGVICWCTERKVLTHRRAILSSGLARQLTLLSTILTHRRGGLPHV